MPTHPRKHCCSSLRRCRQGSIHWDKRVLAIHGEDYTRQYHICIDKVLPFSVPCPLCLCWHTLLPPAFQWLTSSIALLEVTAYCMSRRHFHCSCSSARQSPPSVTAVLSPFIMVSPMGIRPLPKPSERPKAAVAASIVGLRQGQRVSVLPSCHNSSLMQSHSGMKEAVSVFRQRCSPIQAACGQDHICLPIRHFCLPRAYDCGE